MKFTKVIKYILLSLCSLLVLIACQTKSETNLDPSTKNNQVTIQIAVQGQEETELSKSVAYEEGQNLLSIMKENYDIEEKQGMITTIENLKADQGDNQGRFWKLLVNDDMSETGAQEIKPQDQDTITFDLTDDWSF